MHANSEPELLGSAEAVASSRDTANKDDGVSTGGVTVNVSTPEGTAIIGLQGPRSARPCGKPRTAPAVIRVDDEQGQVVAELLREVQSATAPLGSVKLRPTGKNLGIGGFGEVNLYKFNPRNGKSCLAAVKTANAMGAQDASTLKSLLTEIRILQRLHHSSVVRYLGSGILPSADANKWPHSCDKGASAGTSEPPQEAPEWERAYVATEYMPGGSVERLLALQFSDPETPCYDFSDALAWCIDGASALEYLHSQRPIVLHRDFKGGNLLLCADHKKAKLADFGLSTMAACCDEAIRKQHSAPYSGCGNCFELGSSSLDSRTMSSAMELAGERGSVAVRGYAKTAGGVSVDELGRIAKVVYGTVMDPNSYNLTGGVGSLLSMAPEVFRQQPYNEKADTFSFGVLIFEVFSRRSLASMVCCCSGGTHKEVYRHAARIADGFRPQIPRSWDQELARLVTDCWQQEPSARPSAAELKHRLEKLHMVSKAMDGGALDAPCCHGKCAIQ